MSVVANAKDGRLAYENCGMDLDCVVSMEGER